MQLTTENKVILITGAFGLIGKTVAEGFLQQGAKVILADSNIQLSEEIKNTFSNFGNKNFLVVNTDITDPESCTDCINQSLSAFGKIDVLINNAAIDAKFDGSSAVNHTAFENYPLDLFRKSVDVNITGTIIMTQAACRQMLKQKSGNIINVASVYSLVAPNQKLYDNGSGEIRYKPVDYVVTKSFIPNFTRYIATFYADKNIRCNAIAPHGIFNDHDAAFMKNFSELSPMGRMCEKDELIGPFTFLASDASSYMTGSVLTVDGGWTAW